MRTPHNITLYVYYLACVFPHWMAYVYHLDIFCAGK